MKPIQILTIFTPLLLLSCNKSFFKVVSSSFAKEYCSCRFVVGQSKSYCYNYASQVIPVSNFSEEVGKKTIRVKALSFHSIATYKGSRIGCQITK